MSIKVLYIPGLEGGSNGRKPQILKSIDGYHVSICKFDNTYNIYSSFRKVIDNLLSQKPDVVIASSYGSVLAIFLIQLGIWTGPTILLSSAIGIMARWRMWLPKDYPNKIIFVHGTNDTLCKMRNITQYLRYSFVTVHQVHDDHKLSQTSTPQKFKELVEEVMFLREETMASPITWWNYWITPLWLALIVYLSVLLSF